MVSWFFPVLYAVSWFSLGFYFRSTTRCNRSRNLQPLGSWSQKCKSSGTFFCCCVHWHSGEAQNTMVPRTNVFRWLWTRGLPITVVAWVAAHVSVAWLVYARCSAGEKNLLHADRQHLLWLYVATLPATGLACIWQRCQCFVEMHEQAFIDSLTIFRGSQLNAIANVDLCYGETLTAWQWKVLDSRREKLEVAKDARTKMIRVASIQ